MIFDRISCKSMSLRNFQLHGCSLPVCELRSHFDLSEESIFLEALDVCVCVALSLAATEPRHQILSDNPIQDSLRSLSKCFSRSYTYPRIKHNLVTKVLHFTSQFSFEQSERTIFASMFSPSPDEDSAKHRASGKPL